MHVAVAGTETDHLAKLINEKAEEVDAACIVMASHGKTSFQVCTYPMLVQHFLVQSTVSVAVLSSLGSHTCGTLPALLDNDQEGSCSGGVIQSALSIQCNLPAVQAAAQVAHNVLRVQCLQGTIKHMSVTGLEPPAGVGRCIAGSSSCAAGH